MISIQSVKTFFRRCAEECAMLPIAKSLLSQKFVQDKWYRHYMYGAGTLDLFTRVMAIKIMIPDDLTCSMPTKVLAGYVAGSIIMAANRAYDRAYTPSGHLIY